MKKAAVLFAALFMLAGCSAEAERVADAHIVRDEINASLYCETKSDCEPIGSPCPFGCDLTVNRDEAPRLIALINLYNEKYPDRCVYKCVRAAGYDCVAGQCQAVAECREDDHCDYTLSCSRLNSGGVSGYKPMCVNDDESRTGKSCRCMCPDCE